MELIINIQYTALVLVLVLLFYWLRYHEFFDEFQGFLFMAGLIHFLNISALVVTTLIRIWV